MLDKKHIPLTSGRKHTIGKTTFIINSFAAAESSKTASELIMDMLLSIVKSKEESI